MFYKKPLAKILWLGIPSGIQSSTYSLSSVVIQSSVNSLAFIPGFITGNAAAYSIEPFAECITTAFYQASMTFVGISVGAGDYNRVKKSYKSALLLCTFTVAVASSIVILLAKPLLRLYIPDSEIAVSWGVVRILFIFGPLFMQGFMDCTTGTLRGLGVSISNTVISIVGVCGVRTLWCLTVFQIPEYHTPQMLYSIYPITWALITVLQLVVFIIVYKRKKNRGSAQND
jgi:Na+-driven multidrug efflux pump